MCTVSRVVCRRRQAAYKQAAPHKTGMPPSIAGLPTSWLSRKMVCPAVFSCRKRVGNAHPLQNHIICCLLAVGTCTARSTTKRHAAHLARQVHPLIVGVLEAAAQVGHVIVLRWHPRGCSVQLCLTKFTHTAMQHA